MHIREKLPYLTLKFRFFKKDVFESDFLEQFSFICSLLSLIQLLVGPIICRKPRMSIFHTLIGKKHWKSNFWNLPLLSEFYQLKKSKEDLYEKRQEFSIQKRIKRVDCAITQKMWIVSIRMTKASWLQFASLTKNPSYRSDVPENLITNNHLKMRISNYSRGQRGANEATSIGLEKTPPHFYITPSAAN